MPKVGDISTNTSEYGKGTKVIYVICNDCYIKKWYPYHDYLKLFLNHNRPYQCSTCSKIDRLQIYNEFSLPVGTISNPNVGDVKPAFGHNSMFRKKIYLECSKCKMKNWVEYSNYKTYLKLGVIYLCNPCGLNNYLTNKRENHKMYNIGTIENPNIGDIRYGSELGYYNQSALLIFSECINCHKTRWVSYVKGKARNNHCINCSNFNHRGKINKNEKNGQWKGDEASYTALHHWIRTRKPKPSLCERCHKNPPYDLANISGTYKRDINDFEWLCRKCHMNDDGRINNLKQFKV
ncbi:MAG: hypothetical protein WC389_15585 [Lutibacter sp.]|jgi:ribosomal protein L33